MATQAEKFKEIADAIREKTQKDVNFKANDFADEIMKIDRFKLKYYPDVLGCGYYGNRAAKVAATYHLARVLGKDTFIYDQSGGIFASSTSSDKAIRDGDKKARIDCSTFVGLVLRGITYEKSPFASHKSANATWDPSTELSSMYGSDGWEFEILDKQPKGVFNNIGISGYSTVRTAADLGEFFYRIGYVVFDSKVSGEMTKTKIENLKSKLKPGDIVFWSKPGANDEQKKRFRAISHVGIISEQTSHYLHVTTGNSVVLYSSIDADDGDDRDDKFNNISLICRPDYRPRKSYEKTPIGINLLHFPWVYSASDSYTTNGVTLTIVDKDSIKIKGTNNGGSDGTKSIYCRLKGNANTGVYLRLSAGTYELSGMGNTGVQNTGVALQVRKINGTSEDDFATSVRCYDGHNATFTIDEEQEDVVVVLYIGLGYTVDCQINPTLVRIS